jgi:cytochrome c oxidase subunit 2
MTPLTAVRFRIGALLPTAMAAWACGGTQSSLAPAGDEAARIAGLFWWMCAGAVIVWIAVSALGWYYGRPHEEDVNPRRDRLLIVGAGVVLPVAVLTVLLAFGVAMIPPLVARAPAGSLQVHVAGELWWWRVRYLMPAGPIELANELRLPVGEPVQLTLTSANVLHAFWVPSLGGKIDMIPGRTTHLALRPTRPGIYSGACAEYCGTAHAFMRLSVEVMEREAFDAWLSHQAADAARPTDARAERGRSLLVANGCGACHRVRGTPADGTIAPDLTHVASRASLAAGSLPNTQEAVVRWLAAPRAIKPGAHMPAFRMLSADDREALGAYLASLR